MSVMRILILRELVDALWSECRMQWRLWVMSYVSVMTTRTLREGSQKPGYYDIHVLCSISSSERLIDPTMGSFQKWHCWCPTSNQLKGLRIAHNPQNQSQLDNPFISIQGWSRRSFFGVQRSLFPDLNRTCRKLQLGSTYNTWHHIRSTYACTFRLA